MFGGLDYMLEIDKPSSIHRANYESLIQNGEITLPYNEYVVLIRKLNLEGLDYHSERVRQNEYLVEVY